VTAAFGVEQGTLALVTRRGGGVARGGIWLLFYGRFLLAIASLLYSAYCALETRLYATPYKLAEAGLYWNGGAVVTIESYSKRVLE